MALFATGEGDALASARSSNVPSAVTAGTASPCPEPLAHAVRAVPSPEDPGRERRILNRSHVPVA